MNKVIKLVFLIVFIVFQQACGQVEEEENVTKMLEYYNSAQYDKALIFVDKLIENNPKSAVNWTMKGQILHNLERKKEAFEAIDKALEINPEHYRAYEYRAAMYSLDSQVELALKDINFALKINPNDYELTIFKIGYLLKLEQVEKAIEECNRVLITHPNDYKVLVYRSHSHKQIQNYSDALLDLNRAIAINPKNPFAYQEKAELYLEKEEYKFAVDSFSKVIENMTNSNQDDLNNDLLAFAYNNRGFSWYKLGENEKALADINHSLKLLPTNSYAYRNLALISIDMEEENKVCEYLEKAIELGFTKKYGNEVQILIDTNCK